MCCQKRFVTGWATLYEVTRRQGYPRMETGLPWAPVLPRRAEGAQGRLGRPSGERRSMIVFWRVGDGS